MSEQQQGQKVFTVNLNDPMFEARGPDGQVWKIYFNGQSSGFPPGTLVINHSLACVYALMSALRQQGVMVTEDEAWGWQAGV